MRVVERFVFALSMVAISLSAAGQDYPTRPIKVILPLSAGSVTDAFVRALFPKMTAALGKPFIVENVPGASGIVGTVQAAKAAPDGYTIAVAFLSSFSLNPHTVKDLAYDPVKDFSPVCRLGGAPEVLAVNPSLGVKTLPEFIAKAKGGTLAFASSGNGSITHLAQEMFKARTGTTFLHVPYKGASQAVMDTVGGQTQAVMETTSPLLAQIRAGKLIALATTSTRRLTALPDVPTFEELGYKGFVLRGWSGLVVPARTPTPIINRLAEACKSALASPDIVALGAQQGFEVDYGSPAETSAFIASELSRFGEVARQAGIKPE